MNNESLDSDEDLPCLESVFDKRTHLCEEKVDDACYILHLDINLKSNVVCIALSNKEVKLYNLENGLEYVSTNKSHKDIVTEVKFSKNNDNLLWTCSKDGTINLWDRRTTDKVNSSFQDTTDEKAEKDKLFNTFDVSSNERLLCAGTDVFEGDSFLLFWDVRSPRLLGGFWESHTDDITQVRFDENDPNRMLSASTDGLINLYDLTQTCEDDALIDTINTESSVERISWFKRRTKDTICCITHTADFQMWDIDDPNPLANLRPLKIAEAMARKSHEYIFLVDSFLRDEDICLLSGSNAGDGECARILKSNEKFDLEPFLDLTGNKQRIRSSSYDSNLRLLITGGEKGILNAWSLK